MSSQLISIGSVGASVGAQASVAPGNGGPKTLMDVFGALLAGATGEAGAEISQTSINGLDLGDVAQDVIAGLLGQTSEASSESQVSLVALLKKIEAALEAGATIDPELLKQLGEMSDAMAALVGQTEVSAGVVIGSDGIEVGSAGAVEVPGVAPDTDPLQPTLKGLADRLAELGEKLALVDPELAEKLSVLAEKLAAAKTSIADLIKEIPELRALLDDVKVEGKGGATVTTPALGTPELKLPENASLSAKARVEAAPETAPTPASDEAPEESESADQPATRLQVKAEGTVKADQPAAASLAEKREIPTPPMNHATAVDAAAAATTTGGSSANVHGEVRAVHSAYQAPSPINLPHMAFEIARQVQQGVSKFQIRLDPPELGRIDVALDMDRSGQVNAKLTVERSETLDLLQRDQRALERALAQAGLDANKTNLEFSLKQNPFAGQDGKGGHQAGSPFGDARAPVIVEAEPSIVTTVYRGTASAAGVNIFV